MITKKALAAVRDFQAPVGRVLSVYLDVDQSKPANLNRGFETAFEAAIPETARTFEDEDERHDFDGCVAEARKWISTYQPAALGLVLFARSTGSIWFRELNVPFATQLRWGETAFIQEFVEALDEFEPYAVAVADRSHSRIFTVRLGSLQKHAEVHATGRVGHVKKAGMDHLYSQSHIQRQADEHALSHLKRVVQVLEDLAKTTPFRRLIIAGTTDGASALFRLLPKSLRGRVIATVGLAPDSSESQILNEVQFLARKAERAQEIEKAERLITASEKRQKAVIGWAAAIKALNEKCVRELVYAEGFTATGGDCAPCHALFESAAVNCRFCGLPVKPVEDLIEAAIGSALEQGAAVEQLRGEAADILGSVGGVGAFLRF